MKLNSICGDAKKTHGDIVLRQETLKKVEDQRSYACPKFHVLLGET